MLSTGHTHCFAHSTLETQHFLGRFLVGRGSNSEARPAAGPRSAFCDIWRTPTPAASKHRICCHAKTHILQQATWRACASMNIRQQNPRCRALPVLPVGCPKDSLQARSYPRQQLHVLRRLQQRSRAGAWLSSAGHADCLARTKLKARNGR